ncbi:uncharacterized protein BO97DRAFT_477518 [Aspergillus homomorphus CBS 101889]|uniref:Uncharacterized protein n=1 Tax=Aspergillus homomorphus (strain CBS 101889) TaxID=1450537 RepID=A0A395HY44_ASPHC|nr:hypothetical protein BO97DRAFT_477518 [Aspergillus homomorphus CBS 101889]RAL12852.1 hypothetical protein BO97DRAFT_477518 [Aspergillus homomorphus CBS 101889]
MAMHSDKLMSLSYTTNTDVLDGEGAADCLFVPRAPSDPRLSCLVVNPSSSNEKEASEPDSPPKATTDEKKTWIMSPSLYYTLDFLNLGEMLDHWLMERKPRYRRFPNLMGLGAQGPPVIEIRPSSDDSDDDRLWDRFLRYPNTLYHDEKSRYDLSNCSFDRLETVSLRSLPSEETINERIGDLLLRYGKYTGMYWGGRPAVYLVTSVKVARGFRSHPTQPPVDLVYAYQAHVITLRGMRRGPTRTHVYCRPRGTFRYDGEYNAEKRGRNELHMIEMEDFLYEIRRAYKNRFKVELTRVVDGTETCNAVAYQPLA